MTVADAVAYADRVKGYMFVNELRWLAETAHSLPSPAAWCEIGSWQGRSATAVAGALPRNSRLQLVDNFTGPTTRESPRKADVRKQLTTAIGAMRKRSPTLRVTLADGYSAKIAMAFPAATFDVIFIDGDHAYDAVVADINSWLPTLKPAGLLCGHDFTNKCGVEPAVRELCAGFEQVPDSSIWVLAASSACASGMIRVAPVSLAAITRRLAAGTPTTLSRWGDGEWRCLLGYSGENCDGHPYSSPLRADLTRVLESQPTYFLGMQPFAVRTLGDSIDGWLARRHLRLPWLNADVFHRASIEGKLDALVAALRTRAVLIIGPSALHPLPPLPRAAFLSIPAQNCYTAYADTLARAQTIIRQAAAPLIVAVSAGMMANVLIHDLHAAHPQHSYLDCGSLWDPYVGVVSRKYHKRVISQLAHV